MPAEEGVVEEAAAADSELEPEVEAAEVAEEVAEAEVDSSAAPVERDLTEVLCEEKRVSSALGDWKRFERFVASCFSALLMEGSPQA